MKAKVLCAAILLFIAGAFTAHADINAPELEFKPVGGGRFIYCNNPEAIDSHTIMNGENPRYVMNNDDLGPGKYYIYLSHYNFIGNRMGVGEAVSRDMELDVELTPVKGECEYTLSNIGFETADIYAYLDDSGKVIKREPSWGMLNCCASAMGKSIIDLDGDRYYPHDGENEVFEVKDRGTRWLSEFIPNYSVVHYRRPVHIQAVLEIKSGLMNVNVCAFEAAETLGDRSSMPKEAENGIVRYDRTIKGVADTLPQVRAELEYTIGDDTEDGTYLPVTMHNQYAPDGVVNYTWITHIAPLDDPWAKAQADESGMLAFKYKDDSKLSYYGKNVSKAERTNIWYFDTRHTDTHKYENQPGTKGADLYSPNYEITAADEVNGYATNLGNYGVTYTYNIKIKNTGSKTRYFTYQPTTASNILVYTDANGKKADCAFVKNSYNRTEPDIMSVVELPAGKTTELSLNVVLPVNFNGGIRNAFIICDEADALDFERVYAKHKEYKEVPAINGKYLSAYKDKLPEATYNAFYGTFDDYEVLDCGTFYAVRWCIWDTMGNGDAWWLVNHVYILDDDFNITGHYTHKSLPIGMSWSNGRLYVKTARDGIYSTKNGTDYRAETITELPQNEWVYHPKRITFGDYLNGKTAPHKINISGFVTELTDNEYKILYEAIKDIPLKSYMRYSGGTTGMPYISIDDQSIGRGLLDGIYHGGDYYTLTSSEDYSKVDKLLNYFLYMGENADKNDLNISDWAYADIKTAMEYGIVEPELITYGGPRDVTRGITRMEFCRMAKNVLEQFGSYFTGEAENGFKDIRDQSDALLASQLSELGIITGYEDGTFRPDDLITRQEAAVILSRMLKVFGMASKTELGFGDMEEVQAWARDGLSVTVAYGIMNGVGDNRFDPAGTYTVEQSIVTMLREFNAMINNGCSVIQP